MPADKKLWRNRKERKQWARRLQSEDPGLEVIHPHAAGIDVGISAHYRPVTIGLENLSNGVEGPSPPTVLATMPAIASTGALLLSGHEAPMGSRP